MTLKVRALSEWETQLVVLYKQEREGFLYALYLLKEEKRRGLCYLSSLLQSYHYGLDH